MGIGAVEELVEEEEQRERPSRQVDQLPHAGDLGVEPRAAGLERILDSQGASHGKGAEPEPGGPYGAPARASTVLTPTVRNNVLFPDMFEPLTIKARVAPPRETSLTTQSRGWISGWPTASAWKQAGPAAISGKVSEGFSAA